MEILVFFVCLGAAAIGSICGIGGGVIVKPVVDLLGIMSASTTSFLSGCMVLAMSAYSIFMRRHDNQIELRTGMFLSLGAMVGGIEGKNVFQALRIASGNDNAAGLVQAAVLAVITLLTLFYAIRKGKIRTYKVVHPAGCTVIGFALGFLSALLGIGGGPINLMALSFFFSMDTKKGASNSLLIILFSQTASLVSTIINHSVPAFSSLMLVLMVAAGILGGIIGSGLYRRMSCEHVDKQYRLVMVLIIVISIYNVVQFAGKA